MDKIKLPRKIENANWIEIKKGKEDFINILKILNNFYRARAIDMNLPINKFREDVVSKKISDLKILLLRYAKYEFLVWLEVNDKNQKKSESWIHVDGITMERELLNESGISEHPIFKIVSMNDIYEFKGNKKAKESPLSMEWE